MKRLWSICAAMALLFSCTESPEITDDFTTTTPEENIDGISITTNISMPQSESTKIASDYGAVDSGNWAFTWEDEDKTGNVYAYYKTESDTYGFVEMKSSSDFSEDATSAIFTGTLPEGTTYYRVLYKSDDAKIGGATDPTSVTDESASIDLTPSSSFSGNTENLVMISDLLSVDNTEVEVDLKHVGSFIVLDISFLKVQDHWKDVEIKDIEYTGEICLTTGEAKINYWDDTVADVVSTKSLLSSLPLIADETTIKYEPSSGTYANEDYTKSLYINILPTTFAAGTEATITISFTNGTKLIVTKTAISDIYFERATFNTFEVTYESSEGVLPKYGTAVSNGYNLNNTYVDATTTAASSTSTNSLKYYFGGETENDDDEEFTTSTTSYNIWTEDHLAALAALANDGKISDGGYTFNLMKDIEITSDWWTPIGYKGYGSCTQHFAGTFDGGGHTISGYKTVLTTSEDLADYVDNYIFASLGLFGYVTDNVDDGKITTVVKDLIIKDSYTEMGEYAGKHVAVLTGTLENAIIINCGCESSCTAKISSSGAIGAIVGNTTSSHIYNSYNKATLIGAIKSTNTANLNIGGICGTATDGGTTDIYNCYSIGDIDVTVDGAAGTNKTGYYAGAIMGHDFKNNTFTNVFCLADSDDDGDSDDSDIDHIGYDNTEATNALTGGTIDSEGKVTLLEGTDYYTLGDDKSLTAALHAFIIYKGGSETTDDYGNVVKVSDWAVASGDTYPTLTFTYTVEKASDSSNN